MPFTLLSRIKSLIKRQPSSRAQEDFTNNFLSYYADNNWPLKLAKAIQDSETAISCLDTRIRFTQGASFSDRELEKMIVNSQGQALWEFHREVVRSWETFRGVYINVKYSLAGTITELYVMAFENCRLGIPDRKGLISTVVYNPFFGTSEYRSSQDTIYPTFNDDAAIVKQQIATSGRKYGGQVLYFGEYSPLSRFYPRQQAATSMNWMLIEAAIAIFHRENLASGMFQSVLMRVIGDPNEPSQHPDDQALDQATQTMKSTRTIGERFNLEMQEFAGFDRVGNVMVQWAKHKDAVPSFQAFPTNLNAEFFSSLSDRAADKILLAYGVPFVLGNIVRGAMISGDANIVRVAVKLMQTRVADDQKTILINYRRLLRNFKTPYTKDFNISPYVAFPALERVDKKTWGALSQQERRQWIKENTPYKLSQ